MVGELGFGGGEVGGESLVVEHGGDPAGEVVAGAVVAQRAAVTEGELGFELGQVGGDRSGGGVALAAEIEPVGGLNAGMVVLVLVAQVRGASRPRGERHGLVGVRSPGQHSAAGWSLQEPGDLRWGHVGDSGGEVDQVVGGAR